MIGNPPGECREVWNQQYRIKRRRYGRAPGDLPTLFPGAMVLEAGCGSGKTLSAMVSLSWKICAIDFSREALLLCKTNPLIREESEFIQAEVTHLPFRDELFDAVFVWHIAGHLPELSRASLAGEAIRILKHGGRLFFRDFSVHDFRAGKGILVEPSTYLRGDGIRTHYFTRDEVLALFSSLMAEKIRDESWQTGKRRDNLNRSEITGEFRKT